MNEGQEPIANEAHVVLSEAELGDLRRRAESGDRAATLRLVDFYLINYGDLNEDGIYWQVHAARQGDCEQWADLMFMEIEDGHPVPARFFSPGETLRGIGETADCPPYTPRRL